MKRVLMYLSVALNGKVEKKALPETLVNEEIVRLTNKVPRTQAEKNFHDWLCEWRERNGK